MVIAAILTALAAFIFLVSLILSFIHETSVNPPKAVVRRIFGKIDDIILPGDSWFWLIPYIHSTEEVEIDRFWVEIKKLIVTTPDNVSNTMDITIALRPIPEKNASKNFWESGGKNGVIKTITKIAEQETRQWARVPGQKPETWEDLQSSQDQLVEQLKNKLIQACGGKNNGQRLNNYGVYLDNVAVGEIKVDPTIDEAKNLEAKETLEKRSELADLKTKIVMAKELAPLSEKEKKAFQTIKELEILQSGKTGGIYRLSLGDLSGIFKKIIGKPGGAQ